MNGLVRRLRRRQSDEGSALILALIVTVVLGIVMGAALSFAGTGLEITTKTRDLRNQNQYIAGVTDAAINQIRSSSTAGGFHPDGVTPYDCPEYDPPAPTNDLGADSSTYKVTCSPEQPSTPFLNEAVPTFAVLTLGSEARSCSGDATCVGFNDLAGNHTLQVSGGLFSHGDITVSGGSNNNLVVQGSAYGMGAACDSGSIHPTDLNGLHCPGYVEGSPHIGDDPNYAAGIGDDTTTDHSGASAQSLDTTTRDPLPTCSGGVAYFSPGYYSVIPDTLTANPNATGCSRFSPSSGLEVFQPTVTGGLVGLGGTVTGPGYYYFDFAAPGGDARQSTWVPNEVIGGVPTSTSSIDWTNPCVATPMPPATTANYGVQFEFGGASSINFPSGGQFGICGPDPNATKAYQDISIYGLSIANKNAVAAAPSSENLLPANQDPTNTNTLSLGPQFQTETLVPVCTNCPVPGATTVGDGSSGSVSLGSKESAGLKYSSFDFSPVKDGSRINSVGVCVTDSPDANATPSVTVTLPAQPGGSAVTKTATLAAPTTKCPAPNDLYTLSSTNLAAVMPDAPQWMEAKQLNITYKVTEANGQTGTSTIDGLTLDVGYTKPALEALAPQNNQPNGSTCQNTSTTLDFFCLNQPANSVGAMVATGTFYTPSVDAIVLVQNGGIVLFQRGVIANSVTANDSASFKQTNPPFRVSGPTPGLGRLVLFQTYADNVIRLRACVQYVDNVLNADGTLGAQQQGYQVKVLHWDVLHGPDSLSPTCT